MSVDPRTVPQPELSASGRPFSDHAGRAIHRPRICPGCADCSLSESRIKAIESIRCIRSFVEGHHVLPGNKNSHTKTIMSNKGVAIGNLEAQFEIT